MAVKSLFAGGGELGALMQAIDWSETSLGAVEHWSQSLKTAVRIMLTSRQPMFVWWGEELINLYNDAYKAIVGGKHPKALGQPASEVWREIWDQVGPRAASAMLNNEGTYDEALLLIMERNGYPEETYYTFSYSPVPDDPGNTGGIICANSDDTQRMIGERQLALLRELAARTADARTFEQACTLSATCLETNSYDLPFAMIYLLDADQQHLSLAGTCGIDSNHVAVPETVAVDADSIWSFTEVIQTHQAHVVAHLDAAFDNLPTGAWNRPPHQAVVVPIAPSGQTGRSGILVAGLNPFRLFDDNYRRFVDLVAAQISASLANANAYEEERKRAETLAELDRAKTAFFSNVSHEFRTPLTLMLGPLEDTLSNADGELSPQQRETLELVQRNGLRLQKLVNSLLDFSRIEAGRLQAVYQPTDLAAFTAELASVFRSAIERAGLRFIVECSPLPEPVYVDRDLWEKIVLNLLSNAFKFTFEGEIVIRLQADNHQVKLTVQDTGVGVPAEEVPRLFERFHRVNNTRSRTHEGSGIGLALVQELVKLHGGTISATSLLDQGTTFTIALPFGYAHLPKDQIQTDSFSENRARPSTALSGAAFVEEAMRWQTGNEEDLQIANSSRSSDTRKASRSRIPHSTARILLADDNADMRDYVARLLSQSYEVEAVPDGVAALAAIDRQLPDLVLTDVMMPKLDGFGLLQALRANPQTQELPIILLSARAGEESRIEGLETGADDYLIKPFSARELLARIEATLKMARIRQEAARAVGQSEERFRAFVQQSSEAIWCFELAEPVSIHSSEDEQIEQFFQHGYLSECNQTMAQMYEADSPEALIGARLGDFLIKSDPKNIEYLRAFIRSGYRLVDAESYETDRQGNPKIFLNNLVGTIEDEMLVRAWGTQRDITDRKRAEERLQLYADVVGNAQVGIVVWQLEDSSDPASFRLLVANPTASEATGVDFESLIGTRMAESFPMLVQTPLVQQYIEVVRTGQAVDIGEVVYQEDGIAAGIYSLKAFPLPNQCLGLAFENITARKATETQLRETQHFNQQIAEALPGILFVFDLLEQRAVYINRQISDLLGYRIEQLEAMGPEIVQTIIHPDDLERLLAHFEAFQLAPEGEVLGIEYRIRHANGEWRWLYSQSVVFNRTVEHLARQVLGVSIDITDRKHVEESLREARIQLESALEAGAIYTWRWKIPENRVVVNSAFAHLFGVDPERAAEGLPLEVFIDSMHEDDRDRIAALINQAIQTGEAYVSEYRVRTASGEERWLKAQGRVEYDADGRAIAFPGALADITAAKHAEIERENLLAREQAAREQAESANRIKDEFLAVLSHELRTPLNPILGWTKLLRMGKLDAAKTARALETIERNTQLQTQLIEDLLDVSRILRGKLSLDMVPVNLVTTIEAALETVQLAAEAKAIQLQTRLDSATRPVLGDSARLQQVVWNLLSNAVKFTPAGGQVEIRLDRIGSQAQIQVSDTGRGISPSFLPYVFEYFRQADGSTTRVFGGLGLGLAIVRHLVELHGGTVQADSLGEGHGATFTVRLPIRSEERGVRSEENSQLTSLLTPHSSPLSGLCVLLVDDEVDSLELVAFILEQAGATVTSVSSGIEALQVFAQRTPDLLVSDIGMPEMDGYMLIRQIRAMAHGERVPAIALTAYAGEINQQQAIAAGFQHHLSKPVDPQELIQTIASLHGYSSPI